MDVTQSQYFWREGGPFFGPCSSGPSRRLRGGIYVGFYGAQYKLKTGFNRKQNLINPTEIADHRTSNHVF